MVLVHTCLAALFLGLGRVRMSWWGVQARVQETDLGTRQGKKLCLNIVIQ